MGQGGGGPGDGPARDVGWSLDEAVRPHPRPRVAHRAGIYPTAREGKAPEHAQPVLDIA